MQFNDTSKAHMLAHQAVLTDLEAKKVAGSMQVPTLPLQVRAALRELQQPVRLFGENLANVRERLRMELARRQVVGAAEYGAAGAADGSMKQQEAVKAEEEEEEVTKYTNAPQALIEARQAIAAFSLRRAAARLDRERGLRTLASKRKRTTAAVSTNTSIIPEDAKAPAENALSRLDAQCTKTFQTLRRAGLDGSQYGDNRHLSSISCFNVSNMPLTATASWTGTIHLWDASSPALQALGKKTQCHEDRIMGLDSMTLDNGETALLATTSIDLTAKLWKVTKNDVSMSAINDGGDTNDTPAFGITEQAHLQGHAARLCRAAFHPMKQHVATTSFDHTWRLWDIETGKNILLQDGHWRECYGVGFHPDGSLCSTTDFAGVVHLWDLRTGKSVVHFMGHAKRVLNAEFAPTGFQLATAGDDGTIKIWDLRRRKVAVSVPAHSNLVTGLKFAASGEYLASSSFDGTAKLWSCRDYQMLNQFQGHEGKVAGVDLVDDHTIVTCGFDKTLKMWR